MDLTERPLRSVLYIPGGRERALQKARGLAADAIIFDLEDAVGPQEKTQARALLAEALRGDGYGPRMKILRVNGLDSPWGAEDLEVARGLAPDAVLIPKVSSPADVEAVAKALPGQPLWAMMETPRGILNAAAIADHPQLTGLVLGTNDLAKEVGCRVPRRARHFPLACSFAFWRRARRGGSASTGAITPFAMRTVLLRNAPRVARWASMARR